MKTFKFFIDPGHGWLCVTLADLLDVQMIATDFSRYSYRRDDCTGSRFYLEEDCDAPKFLRAFEAKFGKPVLVDCHTNSQSLIRRLPRIH